VRARARESDGVFGQHLPKNFSGLMEGLRIRCAKQPVVLRFETNCPEPSEQTQRDMHMALSCGMIVYYDVVPRKEGEPDKTTLYYNGEETRIVRNLSA